jgi:hypothetical protein
MMAMTEKVITTGIALPAPRIAAESPQRAWSASVVRARTCSAEPEFGAQMKTIVPLLERILDLLTMDKLQ